MSKKINEPQTGTAWWSNPSINPIEIEDKTTGNNNAMWNINTMEREYPAPKTIPDKAHLETVVFEFTQDANCVDGGSDDMETLVVEAKSSLGLDRDGGAFYVLRTEQWSIDGGEEIEELMVRVTNAIGAIELTSSHGK